MDYLNRTRAKYVDVLWMFSVVLTTILCCLFCLHVYAVCRTSGEPPTDLVAQFSHPMHAPSEKDRLILFPSCCSIFSRPGDRGNLARAVIHPGSRIKGRRRLHESARSGRSHRKTWKPAPTKLAWDHLQSALRPCMALATPVCTAAWLDLSLSECGSPWPRSGGRTLPCS